MKKNRSYLLAMLLLLGSCNYLEVVPDNVATINSAFTMRSSAEKFLFTCYSYLPQEGHYGLNPATLIADELWSMEDTWHSMLINKGFQNVVTPYHSYWSGVEGAPNLFMAIRDCNIFLENIDNVLELSAEENARWKAEVKFLKAYYHFYLIRMYGPIPIIRENMPISAGVEEVQISREPVDVGIDYVLTLLDEAIPNLPETIDAAAIEAGRITSLIAQAVKAQVLVLAASPMYNGNTDFANFVAPDGQHYFNQNYDKEKWRVAAEAIKLAIDRAHATGRKLYYYSDNDPNAAIVSIETNLKMNFRNAYTQKWNPEIIWGNTLSLVAGQAAAQARLDGNTVGLASTRSNLAVTLKMTEMYYSKNGVPIDEDKHYDYGGRFGLGIGDAAHRYYIREGYTTANMHFNREPRFYASLGFDGAIWYGQGKKDERDLWYVAAKTGQFSGLVQSGFNNITGIWPKKLVNPENVYSATTNYTIVNYPNPNIRLTDLYLLYAEALNEYYGPTPEVFEYLDKVRERSGLEGVVASWNNHSVNPSKPSSQDGLRNIIHQERAIELAFEGKRFWDLQRWKKGVAELNFSVQGWNVTQRDASDFFTPITLHERKFNQRDYFWPIRELDLVVNKNLVQNPGW